MPDYHQPLHPGETYHLFSRAVGNEKIFRSDENYRYFLAKCQQQISPVADLYTYSLLPNHFHLLVRIKKESDIIPIYEAVKNKPYFPQQSDLSDFIMERFSNWLNGYTKALNKMYRRKGALFMDYLKRSIAKDAADFTNFIFYIHKNAVHHGLARQIGQWPHDAYASLISSSTTNLLKKEVMDGFGGREAFITFQDRPIAFKGLDWDD